MDFDVSAAAKKLNNAIELLMQDSETRALLEMAKADNVTIAFDPNMIGTDQGGSFDYATQLLRLNPDAGDEKEFAETLTHELRHFWQNKKLEEHLAITRHDKHADPVAAFVLYYLREVDAYIFTAARTLIREKNKDQKSTEKHMDEMSPKLAESLANNRAVAAVNFISSCLDSVRLAIERYEQGIVTISETITDIRQHTLKTGIADDSAPYMTSVTDERLIELAKKAAGPEICQLLDLTQAFNAAVAANSEEAKERFAQFWKKYQDLTMATPAAARPAL